MQPYTTIAGVEGRPPVGAVLSVGVKALSLPDSDQLIQGNPRLKGKDVPVYADRFWIVSPFEDERRVRPRLAEFRRFNEAPAGARQMIHGRLVHSTIADAFTFHLAAQKLPRPHANPSGQRPCCTGDGKKATRFAGVVNDEEQWKEIVCPNRLCEFRQTGPGQDGKAQLAACKSYARLHFQPTWQHYKDADFHGPTPLMEWETRGWNSVEHLVGFFRHLSEQAEQLGIVATRADASLQFNAATPIYGLPFSLTLGRKKKEERSFPVVAISPEVDLIAFFLVQRQRLEEIAAGRPLLSLAAGVLHPNGEPKVAPAPPSTPPPVVPGDVIDVTAEATTVGGADWLAEQCEAAVEAIEGELRRLHPGDDARSVRVREDARGRAFGVRTKMLVQQLSLDALTDGLRLLREE